MKIFKISNEFRKTMWQRVPIQSERYLSFRATPNSNKKKTEYIKNFINLSSNKYYFIKYNFFLKKIYIVLHNDSPLFICLQIDLYFRFVCTVHNTGYPNFTQRTHNPNTQNGGTPCITRDLFQLYLAVINV